MAEPRITAALVAQEVTSLKARMAVIESVTTEARAAAKETHDKVSVIYEALIIPEPGQDHGLLHRMAKTTTAIESGERFSGWIIKVASVLAALGVIGASIKLGIFPGEG